jgi:hypothetical protein
MFDKMALLNTTRVSVTSCDTDAANQIAPYRVMKDIQSTIVHSRLVYCMQSIVF